LKTSAVTNSKILLENAFGFYVFLKAASSSVYLPPGICVLAEEMRD